MRIVAQLVLMTLGAAGAAEAGRAEIVPEHISRHSDLREELLKRGEPMLFDTLLTKLPPDEKRHARLVELVGQWRAADASRPFPAMVDHLISQLDGAATTACVTGASGYLGSVLVSRLAARGYNVVGTMRQKTLDRLKKLQIHDARLGPLYAGVRIFPADLVVPNSFDTAFTRAFNVDEAAGHQARGCDIVFHTASPYPAKPVPEAEVDEALIKPAVEGTLNVLRSAAKAGVRLVVVTSGTDAIGPPQRAQNRKAANEEVWLTEDDWVTDATNGDGAYRLSKVKAERAAWNFAKTAKFELAVINPARILGPAAFKRGGGNSARFMVRVMDGSSAHGMNSSTCDGIADVRDVADAHISAALSTVRLLHPLSEKPQVGTTWLPKSANGKRHIISTLECYTPLEMSRLVRQYAVADRARFDAGSHDIAQGGADATIEGQEVWEWTDEHRFLGRFVERLPGPDVEEKGPVYRVQYDNTVSLDDLRLKLRSPHATLVDMAARTISLGLVQRPPARKNARLQTQAGLIAYSNLTLGISVVVLLAIATAIFRVRRKGASAGDNLVLDPEHAAAVGDVEMGQRSRSSRRKKHSPTPRREKKRRSSQQRKARFASSDGSRSPTESPKSRKKKKGRQSSRR
jgi:nucleoside-diphosphate-sugar epimerase